MLPIRRIALLGARSTGKTTLTTALTHALTTAGQGHVVVSDTSPLQSAALRLRHGDQASLHPWALDHAQRYDLTLLMGLDGPGPVAQRPRDTVVSREAVDAALRAALAGAAIAYKVIYGRGPQRLENALLAIEGLTSTPPHARAQAQFGLQGGRVAWSCDSCSDPACEHRLFTALLRG